MFKPILAWIILIRQRTPGYPLLLIARKIIV